MLVGLRTVNFKTQFLHYLLVLALIFNPFSQVQAQSAPSSQLQSLEISEDLTSVADLNAVRVEVKVFDISSQDDLKKIQIEHSKQELPPLEHFLLDITAEDHVARPLDFATSAFANHQFKTMGTAQNQTVESFTVEASQSPSFLKRHYNLTLSLIRLVSGTATLAAGLIVGHGVPAESAFIIGVLTGTMSAAIQFKLDSINKWLAKTTVLAKSAKALGFLPNNNNNLNTETITRAERILNTTERYGRWGVLELTFLEVCRAAMHLLNIAATENVFTTLAKSMASQGVYDIGTLKAASELESIKPEWSSRISVFKHVAAFSGSAVSILAAIGSMIGMPFSTIGFVALTSTGLLLNFSPKLVQFDFVKKSINKKKSPSLTCRELLN